MKILARFTALLALAGACSVVSAQAYPAKPVRLVVPSVAGGSTDVIARIVAQKLSASLGQPVIVDNRSGAAGNIASEHVAKSANDGYTLLVAYGGFSINPALYKKLPFDSVKDFDPVIQICSVTGILVVNPALPARTAGELIALAKSRPGQVSFASAGSGTVTHLAGELFKSMAGIEMLHVPYKGSSPALTDVLGGQVSAMFANMPGTLQHLRSGKLRVLAVTSAKRSPLLPEIPTIAEAGLPGYEAGTWYAVLAPAGTPKTVVARINTEIARALQATEMLEYLNSEGATPAGGTPEQFGAFLKTEFDKWSRVVRASGASVD